MRILSRTLALALLSALLLPGVAASQDTAAAAAPAKVRRWESNLSGGSVSNGGVGLVKSFWWYAWPKVVALGLSFDYVYEALPLSLDIALNAPIPVVVPFVCAGAGGSLTSGGLTFFGGGIKIRLKIEDRRREMDFRVSCLPTLWGEKLVMRLLDKSKLMLDMTKLGFEPESLAKFKHNIDKPYGIVLVTGPTGSGKTNTLYFDRLGSPDDRWRTLCSYP